MISFRQFLLESDINTLLDKKDKLKIQLDDTNHSIQSHLKMKRFTDDQVAWSEKYKTLKMKLDTINANIKANDEQINLARKEPKKENFELNIQSNILSEAKQVGTLYHLTNLDGMEFIMKSDKIVRKLYDGISFTRNKMLNFYEGHPARLYFKLIIDGDKLSNKYKIEPFKYHSQKDNVDFRNEAEEIIKTREISNVSNYIKGVAFIYRNFEGWDEEYYEERGPNGLMFRGNFKTFLNKDLPDLLNRIDRKFGLYVQLGSQIKKDNNWFKDKGLL